MKILIFDLDNTLLNSDELVAAPERETLTEMSRRGLLICYITARSPRAVPSILEGLPCDAVSYYNGAVTHCGGQITDENLINYSDGIAIYRLLESNLREFTISVYAEPYSYRNGTVVNLDTKEVTAGTILDMPENHIQRLRITADFANFDIARHLPEYLSAVQTRDGSIMVLNKNAVKERALRAIAEHFTVDTADVMSFGDDLTDIEMIKASGVGVAIGNAIDELKEAADFVADTNDNHGVSKFLRGYFSYKMNETNTIELKFPNETHETAARDYYADHTVNGETTLHGDSGLDRALSDETTDDAVRYTKWLEIINGALTGGIKSVIFFAVRRSDSKMVGTINVRYPYEGYVQKFGHIGYGVHPSERRKGYGTAMLNLALDECRLLGLERVLIVCDKSNPASAKTIIKCGGVLEREEYFDGKITQRYWIEL